MREKGAPAARERATALPGVLPRMRRWVTALLRTAVSGPPAGRSTEPRLASRTYPLRVPLALSESGGWKPHPLFDGRATGPVRLASHASVLPPGHSPHPPHEHREEELLLLLTGEADVILPGGGTTEEQRRAHLVPGRFAYYPAGFAHTLVATGSTPANYLMFKWHGGASRAGGQLEHRLENAVPIRPDSREEGGFRPRLIFEGPTLYLDRLQCHVSTLGAGAGYEPHADEYDVAVVVLEGEVETLGERLGPFGVVFYRAGDPHGMRNPGRAAARYLVFEFHPGR